jgi:hypothetical protein
MMGAGRPNISDNIACIRSVPCCTKGSGLPRTILTSLAWFSRHCLRNLTVSIILVSSACLLVSDLSERAFDLTCDSTIWLVCYDAEWCEGELTRDLTARLRDSNCLFDSR